MFTMPNKSARRGINEIAKLLNCVDIMTVAFSNEIIGFNSYQKCQSEVMTKTKP